MPRKPFIYIPPLPVHITARCINRDWFGMALPDVWQIMTDYLYFISKSFEIQIYGFVLMSNHFHLMASAPKNNLSDSMLYFLRETSRNITRPVSRINQTYGNRFYRCLIDSHIYFRHSYKYLYRNPVEAGMVLRVEDYSYSTLPGLLGKTKLIIPVLPDELLLNNPENTLSWLNKSPSEKNKIAISNALRKVCFRLPQRNGNPHDLESYDY